MSDRYDKLAREWFFGVDVENGEFEKEKNSEASRLAAHFRSAAPPAESGSQDVLIRRLNIGFDYIARCNTVTILSLDEMQDVVFHALKGEFDGK